MVAKLLAFIPRPISTLLLQFYNDQQETEGCNLTLYGYICHQSTYTPLWGASYKQSLKADPYDRLSQKWFSIHS